MEKINVKNYVMTPADLFDGGAGMEIFMIKRCAAAFVIMGKACRIYILMMKRKLVKKVSF